MSIAITNLYQIPLAPSDLEDLSHRPHETPTPAPPTEPTVAAERAATTPAQSTFVAETTESAAVAEFLEWAQMSPAERIRAQYLDDQGLTEEQLAQLPEEIREEIETEIKERIKMLLGAEVDTGKGAADQTAAIAYETAGVRMEGPAQLGTVALTL